MTNQDYGALIRDLTKRVDALEAQLAQIQCSSDVIDQDWDNATLMREWGICERTAANYRKHGLQYYKRGGRVYYPAEARSEFRQMNKE